MAKHRLNPDVARVTGADKRSPGRFKGRSDPQTDPLGDPPANLTESMQAEWHSLFADIPWLRRSDRGIVALTVRLLDALHTNPAQFPISGYGQLRLCLSSLGATPVDRSRVSQSDDEYDDPATEFLN